MWRDPLDELIEDIERTLPPVSKATGIGSQAWLLNLQLIAAAAIWPPPERLAALIEEAHESVDAQVLHRGALDSIKK